MLSRHRERSTEEKEPGWNRTQFLLPEPAGVARIAEMTASDFKAPEQTQTTSATHVGPPRS